MALSQYTVGQEFAPLFGIEPKLPGLAGEGPESTGRGAGAPGLHSGGGPGPLQFCSVTFLHQFLSRTCAPLRRAGCSARLDRRDVTLNDRRQGGGKAV